MGLYLVGSFLAFTKLLRKWQATVRPDYHLFFLFGATRVTVVPAGYLKCLCINIPIYVL